MDKKPTDSEIVKALKRLKNTKDYLKEQYQEQAKKCPYPELKPIAKRTYEDNKKAFDIAIKAVEEFNRLQAEKNDLFYKLTGVMHSVDKWLDGDELKEDEVNRAATMREKTLQIAESLQAENERLKIAFKNSQKTTKYWHNKCGELVKEIQTAKTEAVTEFAERLKAEYTDFDEENEVILPENLNKAINDLLKEKVGALKGKAGEDIELEKGSGK